MGAPKGSRNNPVGRPLKGSAVRVTLTARVDPETIAGLRAYAAANNISLGAAMDDAWGLLDAWQRGEGKA